MGGPPIVRYAEPPTAPPSPAVELQELAVMVAAAPEIVTPIALPDDGAKRRKRARRRAPERDGRPIEMTEMTEMVQMVEQVEQVDPILGEGEGVATNRTVAVLDGGFASAKRCSRNSPSDRPRSTLRPQVRPAWRISSRRRRNPRPSPIPTRRRPTRTAVCSR